MMQNPNLMYAIYPVKVENQELMETFFISALCKDHIVNIGPKGHYFMVDDRLKFKICDAKAPGKLRLNPDIIYAHYHTEVGRGKQIPLWLLGFLY